MGLSQDMSDWTVEQLVEGFENDILYNAHSYRARFERSRAQQELHRRGKASLEAITQRIKSTIPLSGDIRVAWGHLLCLIESVIDLDKTGPDKLDDTEGWLCWAERFTN